MLCSIGSYSHVVVVVVIIDTPIGGCKVITLGRAGARDRVWGWLCRARPPRLDSALSPPRRVARSLYFSHTTSLRVGFPFLALVHAAGKNDGVNEEQSLILVIDHLNAVFLNASSTGSPTVKERILMRL
jgi:hypothetical protein